MPLFDYRCLSCEKPFEALVRTGHPEPNCPSCGKGRVVKMFSAFGVGTAMATASREAPGPRGGCGRCGDPNPCPSGLN